MQTPLNASATTAAALLSNYTFEVPQYQREYAWERDEVSEFWNDLRNSITDESYFLGLVILTGEGQRKQVVDGQQRLLTLSLLAAALYREAIKSNRKALADRLQSDFLRSIDYETDEVRPRVSLSDPADNRTLQALLTEGKTVDEPSSPDDDSTRMREAFEYLRKQLRTDLAEDPFKRLGLWADFLTNKLYFAVFVHPDMGSAYRVFEVINTRGRELTIGDLLKNFVLSQTKQSKRDKQYKQWQAISKQFSTAGGNSFVQYIRHVITVRSGHILPKDLYDFLASRTHSTGKTPPSPDELMGILESQLPLYLQMMDPTVEGPAEPEALEIFDALNSLSVISVRPLLLAIATTKNPLAGMRYILQLVVRRIVVGNLGTGNVERRFGEAARMIFEARDWTVVRKELSDLNPTKEEFVEQLARRSFNKGTLTYLRRSIVLETQTPEQLGVLHFIRPRHSENWDGFDDDEASYWVSTIGNTYLADIERRPKGASTWDGFKRTLLPEGVDGEWTGNLEDYEDWDADAVADMAAILAEAAGDVWY
jgi:Uncharacterized conserved protein